MRSMKIEDIRKKALETPDEKKAWVIADLCISCGACVGACPTSAIEVVDVAHIDRSLCVGDGACAVECPVDCILIGVEDPERSSGNGK